MGKGTKHFDLVKLQNLKVVRNLLRLESPQSISELATKASLTYPTVAALLKELNQNGEVRQSSRLESCGGRPGVRYELDDHYQYGLVLYLTEKTLSAKVYNVYGQFVEKYSFAISADLTVDTLMSHIQTIKRGYPRLTAMAMGVPGVVLNNDILSLPAFPKLIGLEVFETLKKMFQMEVFIENDLNAISMAEVRHNNSFAHIAYINKCIGAGIVINGEIFTGSKGYAGELEYLCENLKEQENSIVTCILSLICVLNLPLIYLSGEQCTESMVSKTKDKLSHLLPDNLIPEILIAEDLDRKYEEGLLKRIQLYWENTI